MNILVVDDEIYIVRGIVRTVDWGGIGISKVLTAFSMEQAQKVFARERIDILLADIEMPKGSGLDLVEWAHGQGYSPVTLFLTSYAKFEYAQKAIQMQCLGYIMKPADADKLDSELLRAVKTIKENDEQKSTLAKYWNDQLIKQAEAFWSDLFNGCIQPDEKSVSKLLQKYRQPMNLIRRKYYYILVQVDFDKNDAKWEKDLYSYAIRNILSEILYHERKAPIPEMDEDHLMLMCGTEQYAGAEDTLAACRKAAEACENALPGKFTLFLAGPGETAEANKYYTALKKLENEYITIGSTALSEDLLHSGLSWDVPEFPISSWSEALLTHQTQRILNEMKALFPHDKSFFSRSFLNDLYYAILQVIYSAYEKKDIRSKAFFANEEDQSYIYEAVKSAECFFRWAGRILEKAEDELNSQAASGYVVENVRQYVLAHIGDEHLNRSRIASEIHLNPDYLSFVFKEKYGQSLSRFIASERINAAKKLLISSDLPITDVSFRTGYSDISYFSKQFKCLTGMTPQQYRKSVFNQRED